MTRISDILNILNDRDEVERFIYERRKERQRDKRGLKKIRHEYQKHLAAAKGEK